MHPEPDSENIISVLVAENIVPTTDPYYWSKTFECPENSFPHEIFSLSKNCKVICKFHMAGECAKIELKSGSCEAISIQNMSDNFKIELEINNEEPHSIISHVSVNFIKMTALPVELTDIIIKDSNLHGHSIAIDFSKALEVATGIENVQTRKVEIRYPDGSICDVSTNSANFTWFGDTLHCKLLSGMTYATKIKYTTAEGNTPEWSRWLLIKPQRKMTL